MKKQESELLSDVSRVQQNHSQNCYLGSQLYLTNVYFLFSSLTGRRSSIDNFSEYLGRHLALGGLHLKSSAFLFFWFLVSAGVTSPWPVLESTHFAFMTLWVSEVGANSTLLCGLR